MTLKPLGDRVVIKQLIAEETTKSGIVLPGGAKEKPQQAEVVAVGPGGVVDGKEVNSNEDTTIEIGKLSKDVKIRIEIVSNETGDLIKKEARFTNLASFFLFP